MIHQILFICLSQIVLSVPSNNDNPNPIFEQLMTEFDLGYANLGVPEFGYDYREHFQNIPELPQIERQIAFFNIYQKRLNALQKNKLSPDNQLHFDHLDFEIRLNLERLSLEKDYRHQALAPVPADGLSQVPKGWYTYRIHFFTGLDTSPEELFEFGKNEVARVQEEIRKIQSRMGFAGDEAGFYKHLQSPQYFLTDKAEILDYYESVKTIAYRNLPRLFFDTAVADIAFMEWAGAGPFTPPGYYSAASDNAYGKGVFHFNFYGGRHNRRAMDWMFIHEAVPGHHYQWCQRSRLPAQPNFKRHFYYPGNFEGWAAYVEYFGKELGLYRDDYSELGKWEWDLVRSVRILIDVGIHHFGWSKEEAITCWKQHITGQDEIAEREVQRCTNWPAQALSYKVGAWKIQQMADRLRQEMPDSFSLPAFHRAFLRTGQAPLEAVEKNIKILFYSSRNLK